jgi:hypothetical protein
MTNATNFKNFIIAKNVNRQGKGELRTQLGATPVEVKKVGQLYYIIIDSVKNGLNRTEASAAWELLSSYVSATLVEDKTFKVK